MKEGDLLEVVWLVKSVGKFSSGVTNFLNDVHKAFFFCGPSIKC